MASQVDLHTYGKLYGDYLHKLVWLSRKASENMSCSQVKYYYTTFSGGAGWGFRPPVRPKSPVGFVQIWCFKGEGGVATECPYTMHFVKYLKVYNFAQDAGIKHAVYKRFSFWWTLSHRFPIGACPCTPLSPDPPILLLLTTLTMTNAVAYTVVCTFMSYRYYLCLFLLI